MDHKKDHNTNNENFSEKEFFSVVQPKYSKTKEDIWSEINSEIELNQNESLKLRTGTSLSTRLFYGIAASIVLLLGTVLLLRFYSNSNYCPDGEQLTVKLPDGSAVTLKSNSSITYFPLWWNFSRKVNLTGEAFFDVEKGEDFIVASAYGRTVVLGTTFNVYAREYAYKVTCFTGMVKVISLSQNSVVLNPNYTAEVIYNGEIKVSKYDAKNEILKDKNNMFVFKSVPLINVIQEIEKYYNIKITSSISLNYDYTGFFSKQKTAEEALVLLCKPYSLTFIALSDTNYHIIKN
jgi:ferric-dicitrate binding protein FerR (iron transport regulator)